MVVLIRRKGLRYLPAVHLGRRADGRQDPSGEAGRCLVGHARGILLSKRSLTRCPAVSMS